MCGRRASLAAPGAPAERKIPSRSSVHLQLPHQVTKLAPLLVEVVASRYDEAAVCNTDRLLGDRVAENQALCAIHVIRELLAGLGRRQLGRIEFRLDLFHPNTLAITAFLSSTLACA